MHRHYSIRTTEAAMIRSGNSGGQSMRSLNNLVVLVSRSGLLFVISTIFAFGSLFIVFMPINVVFENLVGAQLFDFQNELTVEQVFTQLPAYTDASRGLYYAFSFVDFFFPFFASVVLGAAAAFAIRYLSTKRYDAINGSNLFALFFIPTMFDWIENISALTVINAYPEELTTVAMILVIAKKGKLATVLTMQLVAWLLLAMAGLKWIGQKVGLIK